MLPDAETGGDHHSDYERWFIDQVKAGIADERARDTPPHSQVMAALRQRLGHGK
jgi:hypothetical protein